MTAKKTTVETTMQPGRNGGSLKVGNPGHKGGGGRPPDWWKHEAQRLVESPECMAALETIVKHGATADARLWFHVVDKLTDKIYAKPAQAVAVEHSGEIDLVPRPPTYTVDQWAKLCARGKN